MFDKSDSPTRIEPASDGRKGHANDDIAVIGMACRFPGAADYHEFWNNLSSGIFSVREVPEDRWGKDEYYSPRREDENKTVSKWGGFIDDVDKFDAPLFKVSPREAELMDPQQRIALELAWSCIEDAGYAPSDLRGSDIGVYIGVANYDYKGLVERLPTIEAHISTGVHTSLVPNRISFEFDFKGPSIVIDTACSSSLVALDEAVHALRRGDCSSALVGGVSVLCSPTHFVSFSKTGMLAPDGVCKTFDERADGYVRGDGAGLIMLKPLQQALKDGDAIHGLIKGVGVTHGGRAPTVTSPNPFAQSQTIVKAFKNANISPASVNYIEAHGTGTPKGDPIEVNALVRAYSSLAKMHGISLPERSCGIGSVKTNIGHLEPSAGIAGVIKVLLSMKHRALPPLLHFKKLNPRVRFEGSPFYLVTQSQHWPVGTEGVRRAGVSSFGFGGVNAHVLLEDYDPDAAPVPEAAAHEKSSPLLFVISAKTSDSLKRYVRRLHEFLQHSQPGARPAPSERPFSLESLAYSLQKREAMEERLALEASSIEELMDKLLAFEQDKKIDGCWRGNARDSAEVAELMSSTGDLPDLMKGWLVERQAQKIAKLWVKGVSVPDWNLYYSAIGSVPAKLRLPNYQFAKKRYWFDAGRALAPAPVLQQLARTEREMLHPLVQSNTSTFAAQRFSSTFSGEEFFLQDHQVNGDRVLPGVAYLEMAQAALRYSSGGAGASQSRVQLSHVVWQRPLIVGDAPVQAHIALCPESPNEEKESLVSFEIYSGHCDEALLVHSHGKGRLLEAGDAAVLDLAALQRKFTDGVRRVDDYYAAFNAMGIQYGAAHRAIDRLSVSSRAVPEVLARVTVPESVSTTRGQFVLHPSMLDAAFQATLAVAWSAGEAIPTGAFVPFAMDSIEISATAFDSEVRSLWAWVRPAQDRWSADAPRTFAQRMAVPFDIDLCDDRGRIHVAIRGFSTRVMRLASDAAGPIDTQGLLLMKPAWTEQAVDLGASKLTTAYAEHRVAFAGFGRAASSGVQGMIAQLHQRAAAANASIRIDVLDSESGGMLAQRFDHDAIALFEIIQQQLLEGESGQKLLQVIVPAEGQDALFGALAGLIKTVRLEQPKCIAQLVAIDPALSADVIWNRLCHSEQHPEISTFRYLGSRGWIGGLAEMEGSSPQGAPLGDGPWKERGVYLITGGAGGLGRLFAREICAKVRQPTLVLTGRSMLDQAAQNALQRMGGDGATIEYRALDVCDGQAVMALVQDIRQRHGGLNGVIHCAGVLHDSYLAKKNPSEFKQVLAPKVQGTLHLDEATRDVELDFFVLFSSTAAALGNVGQGDYATANAFMDALAHHRNEMRSVSGVASRPGHTLSINWPLWQDGGMSIDASTAQMLRERMGLIALDTANGIEAFYRAMASGESQVVVLQGVLPMLRSRILETPVRKRQAVASTAKPQSGDEREKVQRALLQVAANLLKLEASDIDTRTELSEYGFDSIAYTGLANRISEKYGIEIAPTVFFDYPTIDGITKFLFEEHRDSVSAPVHTAEEVVAVIEPETMEQSTAPIEVPRSPRSTGSRFAAAAPVSAEPVAPVIARSETTLNEPIAIIGMSGCFPMARDLDEFWRNLEQGKDCISEVPKQRWDWQEIFGDPTTQANRSNVKWGGFVDGVDEFDPLFFGISPREALLMDPQQRLLMTHIWKAIEDAGYPPSSLSGTNTGVFVGTANVGYASLLSKAELAIEGYTSTATVPSVGPNRMSFLLNLHGPSEPIETACSSSLIAIHRAVMAMQVGDCDQAIVGGVNTIVTPDLHISFNKAGMLAQDGRCKTFSKDANGYVRGEGVGMLFLKKLKAAEEAGDHIYGVIRGTAENHGGRANSLTSPNSKSQADVLIRAHRKAGFDPRTVTYLETHGTGTSLGDPVEINGIKSAFKALYEGTVESRVEGHSCALASVKTNIGHLELAAGVAGVIKVLLQFRHRQIAPSLHCNELNPHIDFNGSPFYIATRVQEWASVRDADGKELPRRAGVSSFGFGGVNAHVALEEYVPKAVGADAQAQTQMQATVMVPLSAKNAASLRDYVADVLRFAAQPNVSLVDLSYTLQVGRDAMDERLGVVAHSLQDLQQKLQGFLDGRNDLDDVYVGQVGRNREVLGEFANDEDLQATMEVWYGKAKYAKFFSMWVKGVSFDWTSLYRGRAASARPRRISAPTYPFGRDRFWVKPATSTNAAGATPAPAPASVATTETRPSDYHGLPLASLDENDPVLKTLRELESGVVDIERAISAVTAELEECR